MYPLSFRVKALAEYLNTRSLRRAAERMNVSKSSLQRWMKNIDKRRKRRSRKVVTEQIRRCVETVLTTNPFATLQTLCHEMTTRCNVRMSPSTASRTLQKVGWTRKKAFRIIDKTHSAETMMRFQEQYTKSSDDDLICIDEAGFYLGDIPKYGYSPRGRRLNLKCDSTLRRSKLTLLMAISKRGVVAYDVMAHNCKRDDFIAFIDNLDVPTGTRILMDNVAFHHSKETKQAMQRKGFTPLYIPSYSPRFNAIEYAFSQLKTVYRSNCPIKASKTFDYRGTLEACIELISASGFEKCFRHVQNSVQEIMTRRGERICGYDT